MSEQLAYPILLFWTIEKSGGMDKDNSALTILLDKKVKISAVEDLKFDSFAPQRSVCCSLTGK